MSEPYPLEYFALREVVFNVEVSPDGEHVAMLKILSRGGNPVLYIHDSDDMDAKPLRVGADLMEIRSYGWISDSDIVLVMRQKVRDKIDGQIVVLHAVGVSRQRQRVVVARREDRPASRGGRLLRRQPDGHQACVPRCTRARQRGALPACERGRGIRHRRPGR